MNSSTNWKPLLTRLCLGVLITASALLGQEAQELATERPAQSPDSIPQAASVGPVATLTQQLLASLEEVYGAEFPTSTTAVEVLHGDHPVMNEIGERLLARFSNEIRKRYGLERAVSRELRSVLIDLHFKKGEFEESLYAEIKRLGKAFRDVSTLFRVNVFAQDLNRNGLLKLRVTAELIDLTQMTIPWTGLTSIVYVPQTAWADFSADAKLARSVLNQLRAQLSPRDRNQLRAIVETHAALEAEDVVVTSEESAREAQTSANEPSQPVKRDPRSEAGSNPSGSERDPNAEATDTQPSGTQSSGLKPNRVRTDADARASSRQLMSVNQKATRRTIVEPKKGDETMSIWNQGLAKIEESMEFVEQYPVPFLIAGGSLVALLLHWIASYWTNVALGSKRFANSRHSRPKSDRAEVPPKGPNTSGLRDRESDVIWLVGEERRLRDQLVRSLSQTVEILRAEGAKDLKRALARLERVVEESANWGTLGARSMKDLRARRLALSELETAAQFSGRLLELARRLTTVDATWPDEGVETMYILIDEIHKRFR